MNQQEKLLRKARKDHKSLSFDELCQLAQYYGFTLQRTKGSHHIYKRKGYAPLLNFQEVRGEAKPYQVKQLLRALGELGLIDDE
jgi:hypothetical protein